MFSEHSFFSLIYDWGVMPGIFTAIVSGILFLLSYRIPKLVPYRRSALFLSLVCVVGPGLITNVLFKGFWGRPRPVQTFPFGGPHPFLPFYIPNGAWAALHKSFPSGHSSMGFYFIALIFTGRRLSRPKVIRVGLFLTILLGGLLGLSRIAQGGHFFSDVLVSSLLSWYVSLGCDRIIFEYLAKNKFLGYYGK